MKILLFGNIGSGKTTIASHIAKQYPNWKYLAVDDFRRDISDGTLKGDSKAKSAFVKSITHDAAFQLIECTGLGRLGSSVFRRLKKYDGELMVIVLRVQLEECLSRVSNRTWDVPFPENIVRGSDLVQKLHKMYQSNFLFDRWGLRPNTHFSFLMNDDLKDQILVQSIIGSYIKKTDSPV